MPKVMMVVHWPEGQPSVEDIMQKFQLSPDEIDQSYGPALIDDAKKDYVVMVESSSAEKIRQEGRGYQGPFSNPVIEPFGPPKS
jgi:hypothetical protein